MLADGDILLLAGIFWLDRLKESLINLIAFGALLEMVGYLRKELVRVFSRNSKIHESWEVIKEFRTEHFLIFDSKNGSD
jgi:hypothetical protein